MDLGRDESRFARQSRPRSSSRKFGAVDKVGCHMLPVNFAGLRLRTGSEGDLQWEQIVRGRRLEYLVMAADKQHAHELIERLAPSQVPAAIGMLERLLDPVARAIANAPIDDEPLTAEEEKALAESREWFKHNEGIPHEQVLAELGITQEEIDNYKEPS